MLFANGGSVLNVMLRTLDQVDDRLVGHGQRVAWLVYKMLRVRGGCPEATLRDICLTTLLHDVGAYKTEEIDRMVQFETNDVWDHSLYGYLFLQRLSPLKEWAPAVLMHHVDFNRLDDFKYPHKDVAQLISLADRVDMVLNHGAPSGSAWLLRYKGSKFSPQAVDLFYQAEIECSLTETLKGDACFNELKEFFLRNPFTSKETEDYLKMIVYAIDFRSPYTVAHTITTRYVSEELAALMGLSQEEKRNVRYGALLHDLGKIAIPLQILEAPGSLTPEEMTVMRTHMEITEQILGGDILPEIANISLRHHEKLDGSGYPRGLTAKELNLSQRILAVADVISALEGVRSYKGAFSNEKIIDILQEMKEHGQLAPEVVDVFVENCEAVMGRVSAKRAPVLRSYGEISKEYERLRERYASMCV